MAARQGFYFHQKKSKWTGLIRDGKNKFVRIGFFDSEKEAKEKYESLYYQVKPVVICQYCKGQVKRRRTHSMRTYLNSKYCSNKCANQSRRIDTAFKIVNPDDFLLMNTINDWKVGK